MRRVLCCALVMAMAGNAFADDPGEPDVPPPPPPPPGFVTLDHADATSHGGVEYSYLAVKAPVSVVETVSETIMRFEGHAEYVDHGSGIGGYVQMPISYFSESAGSLNTSATGIGDLEVGGLYLREFSQYGVTVVGHGGVSIPTGSTSDRAQFGNYGASMSRVADVYLSLPESTAVRLGVSPIWRRDRVFARVDLGLDIDAAASEHQRYDTALRADFGIGVIVGPVSLTAEMTNTYNYAPNPTTAMTTSIPTGSSWLDTAALAARLRLDHVEPYAAVVFPIDENSGFVMSVAVTVGLEVR